MPLTLALALTLNLTITLTLTLTLTPHPYPYHQVIFDIFFSVYMKEEQDFPRFLATIIFGSLTVGLLSGGLLLFALSLFSNKLKHYNSELQISLTIVAAYANFYFAEAVVGASGILSLVLMGCVCGYGFWPMIVNVEQMRGVWHTLEWLLNTLLFQLTGLIIGYKFMDNRVHASDYGWAVVTYLSLILIRFAGIFLLLPILSRTGYGMTWQGAVVAAWGGLRGALGLALALVMEAKLSHTGEATTGHLIVVHVSVVAVLTLLVNAPTTGPLLGALGMLQTPREKEHALEDLRSRMQDFVLARYRAMERDADGGSGKNSPLPNDKRWRAWVVRHVSTLRRAVEERRKEAEKRVDVRAPSDASAIAARKLTSWARCLFVQREHQQKVEAVKTVQSIRREYRGEQHVAVAAGGGGTEGGTEAGAGQGASAGAKAMARLGGKDPRRRAYHSQDTAKDLPKLGDAVGDAAAAIAAPAATVKGWGKVRGEVKADAALAHILEHSKRRHELRLIYLRIVKRNYGEMSSRELTGRQQVPPTHPPTTTTTQQQTPPPLSIHPHPSTPTRWPCRSCTTDPPPNDTATQHRNTNSRVHLHSHSPPAPSTPHQVALSLMHCVNCASDDADHPLVEWVAMVQERPMLTMTARGYYGNGLTPPGSL